MLAALYVVRTFIVYYLVVLVDMGHTCDKSSSLQLCTDYASFLKKNHIHLSLICVYVRLCTCVSMCVQGLAQLEILCKQLYETTDTAVRHQAEKALVEFTNSTDCLSKCQLLLERGSVSSTLPLPFVGPSSGLLIKNVYVIGAPYYNPPPSIISLSLL